MLVCDWLHSVGQNHFYVMLLFKSRMLFIFRIYMSLCASKKILCEFQDGEVISFASVWTTWLFHSDSHQCLEASNCSRLHPFGRLSNTSERHAAFDK
jgi:hypothetical protein